MRIVYRLVSSDISIYHVCHLYAQVSAVTSIIHERCQGISCGCKGGIALALLVCRLIHLALNDISTLDEMLEICHLGLGYLVILIDGDKQETTQGSQGFFLIGKIDTVDIELAELFGQEHSHKCRFASTLTADEHEYHLGTIASVDLHPLADHRAHPYPEIGRPIPHPGSDACSQLAYPVSAIPCRETVYPLLHRVVLIYTLGVDDAVEVLVPHLDALLQGCRIDIIACLPCQGMPGEEIPVLLLIFHIASNGITAEHVSSVEKLLQQLLVHHVAVYRVRLAIAMAGIGIFHTRPDKSILATEVFEMEDTLRCYLLVYSGSMALISQTKQILWLLKMLVKGQPAADEIKLCQRHFQG